MTTGRVRQNSVNVSQMIPVVAALEEGLDNKLVAVVLFGSQARNEASESSDWDLLLIARELPPKSFPRHLYLKQLLPSIWRGKVTLLAKTAEEFESHLSDLFLDIALDGVILYDTNEYMSKRLAYLRQLIQNQGLHREKRGKELLWHWQEFPGFNWSLEWETAS